MSTETDDALLIQALEAYRRAVADPAVGRRAAEQVAGRARDLGADEALAVALRAAGMAARELYEHDRASQHLDEAVRVALGAGLGDRAAEALITRSAVAFECGDADGARNDLVQARRHAGDAVRAEVSFADALLADMVGDVDASVEAYERALDEIEVSRPELEVKARNNLALLLLRRGDGASAERHLRTALRLAETFSPAFAAIVSESFATVAAERGETVEALRRYDEAENRLRNAELPLIDFNLSRARALLGLQLLDEAAQAAAASVSAATSATGGSAMLAEALVTAAEIALARGLSEAAQHDAASAVEHFRSQRRPGWEAIARLVELRAAVDHRDVDVDLLDEVAEVEQQLAASGNRLAATAAALLQGRAAAAAGAPSRARPALVRARDGAADGPVVLRLRSAVAAASLAELDGDDSAVRRLARDGIAELTDYRAALPSAELRARAAAHGEQLAELGLRSALRSGRSESVWTWLERARAVRVVDDEVRPSELEAAPLLADLRAAEAALASSGHDEPARQQAHARRVRDLEDRIRHADWMREHTGRHHADAPTIARLRGVRAALGGRVLVQYGILDQRLVAVVVRRSGLRTIDLGAVEPVLTSAAHLTFGLQRMARASSGPVAEAATAAVTAELARLADALGVGQIGVDTSGADVSAGSRGTTEVVIAPPTPLMGLPWGALPGLTDVPVRVVPSALAWHQTAAQVPRTRRVLAVAGPGLAAADAEVDEVASCHVGAEVLRGPAATCTAVRSRASGARLVHLACHGRLRSDRPSFSALQLADGPLTVHDLERVREPAHHWVLAACDVGVAGRPGAADLEGVLAVLFRRGAGGVVAATVAVPDLPTKAYMRALHDALSRGASLATAVRDARLATAAQGPAARAAAVAFSCYGGG